MGNITNLATTGNYTYDKDNLKVSFNFTIDKANNKLTRIETGMVNENDKQVANFNTDYYMMAEEGLRMHINTTMGREVELTIAIGEAIQSFENKVAAGEL